MSDAWPSATVRAELAAGRTGRTTAVDPTVLDVSVYDDRPFALPDAVGRPDRLRRLCPTGFASVTLPESMLATAGPAVADPPATRRVLAQLRDRGVKVTGKPRRKETR